MADPPGLSGSPGPEEPYRSPILENWEPQAPRVLRGDKTANRAALYFVLFLVLFVGAFGPVRSGWSSNAVVHGILETLATILAFIVGALALVRFYSKKQGTFLFIGTGFLGTALLETFHALVSTGFLGDRGPLETRDLASWSFTASASVLSIFLFVSWLSWRQESRGPEGREIRELPVYLTALFLTVLTFAVFDLFPVTQAVYPDSWVRHPAEFFPALFFLLALAGFLGKGHWRFDAFEHWLVIALVISVMAHGAYMPFSSESYDADFDAAHLLKVLSYLAVLVGLMASVYLTFRREEEAAGATREANTALAREIDVRRQAERILQESEERLQDFLDNAHDLIQSVDPEGNFLYVNRAWELALGYSADELGKLNFFEILHPDCVKRCRRDFGLVLQGRTFPALEVDIIAADGRTVRCSGSANVRHQDGEAVATRTIFRDISEQVEAKRELEAFQANLRALVENTGDAIWSVDRAFKLVTFNTAFSMALEARTGREPLVGDTPPECFPPPDAIWYGEMYQKALKGQAFSELRDEEIGGQIRSYELFFNPIREAMGIIGVAVFGKDVTARRRTQVALRMAKEEAERANQAKSQFLANMSHELRTPLNSVIGFTNILLKNRSGSLVQQELGFLDRISANGKHLLELINEVLDLAKIEAGRMELDLQPVNLETLIQETLLQMEGQIRERKITLRGDVPPGLAHLSADAGKLKQVIINLVGNSLKFTEKGEVAVSVLLQDDGATPSAIAVSDTGIGIPPERLQAIFEAFQQADGTTSRKYGGTGLGLTISRSLCQLMGYDLKVESEVGEGSTFTILLTEDVFSSRRAEEELIEEALKPMESSRPLREEEPSSEEPAPKEGGHRILVIDDDADARVLMTHYLEDLGCTVVPAGSAGEGLRMARADRPDLITLDLMMPGMTGWEALKEFKDDPELRDIPVVIVSMLAGEGDRADLLGAVDLLSKPVDRQSLLRVLNRNLKEGGDRNILVVEDDPDTQMVIREYLEDAGLQVVVAENGEEAERRLEESVPDAILLDLVMPVMDGMTFLKRLREGGEHTGIPVIICTGKELTLDERSRLQAQASGIVAKGEGFEADLKGILSQFFPLKQTMDPPPSP
ncbi:response regulator [Gemmatimonadota bacterium]